MIRWLARPLRASRSTTRPPGASVATVLRFSRGAFDADELAAQIDGVFRDASASAVLQDGSGGIRIAWVPMMSERTPVSVCLADALADAAGIALGRGALEVFAGSHRNRASARAAIASETEPGDIVAFDEHVTHGGGGVRRQWRVDFIADPRTDHETQRGAPLVFADL